MTTSHEKETRESGVEGYTKLFGVKIPRLMRFIAAAILSVTALTWVGLMIRSYLNYPVRNAKQELARLEESARQDGRITELERAEITLAQAKVNEALSAEQELENAIASIISGTSVDGATVYTGEPISIDFADRVDIREAIPMIEGASDKNIVIDPDIEGEIYDLFLNEVPWDQALDIILDQNGLTKMIDGDVIRIIRQEIDEMRWRVTFSRPGEGPFVHNRLEKRQNGPIVEYVATDSVWSDVTMTIHTAEDGKLFGTWSYLNGYQRGTWEANRNGRCFYTGTTEVTKGSGQSGSITLECFPTRIVRTTRTTP